MTDKEKHAVPATSFWVVERFVDGRSAGYWDGGNSRTFVTDIEEAVQFRRRRDAMWVLVGWHWRDVQITEHVMLDSENISANGQLSSPAENTRLTENSPNVALTSAQHDAPEAGPCR